MITNTHFFLIFYPLLFFFSLFFPHQVGDSGTIRCVDAKHPILLLRGVQPVGNKIVLDESLSTLVISGPNAGGKVRPHTHTHIFPALTFSYLPIHPCAMIIYSYLCIYIHIYVYICIYKLYLLLDNRTKNSWAFRVNGKVCRSYSSKSLHKHKDIPISLLQFSSSSSSSIAEIPNFSPLILFEYDIINLFYFFVI